jgi:putative ABC transport system permease protein
LTAALRAAVRDLDPNLALARDATLSGLVDDQMAARRFNTWLLTAFGIAAIALAGIGLYGLLAYLVALRRHEMAVRLSIGATPGHVLRLILGNVLVVVAAGTLVGLGGALAVATWMRGLLFGIAPWDPGSQSITVGLFAVLTMAAAWVPVRRAMRVDPATVLRTD